MQRNKLRLLIPIVTLLLILVSALYVQTTQNGLIQTSADTKDKTHFMNIWLIYLIPLVVLFVLPLHFKFQPLIQKLLKSERILLILGVLYIIFVFLTPKPYFELFYIYKFVLLLLIPLWIIKREKLSILSKANPVIDWSLASIVYVIWLVLYFSPLNNLSNISYDEPYLFVLIFAIISILVNAVLEEAFYRVWLQTRLEHLGIVSSVCISTVLWSLWHAGIQGQGNLLGLSAQALVTHALAGIFLGFFWAKYRNIYLLILIHICMNFPLYLITYWSKFLPFL
ncbi:MAG: type II CAAX endopeptidase family protein [Staphylococcus simulans]|uniref:CPBP family intramembrane glutamic endopeptidase n=1 Tax=Staphylococcus simulans TaxID=1286 RepID=UPI0025522A44|nr:type II CAAX endopeptidase family protein [Staphylococcus simulans]MDK7926348.1 type II CAAX endopeptidase family protein [Staphylococcus simulans]MDK8315048.1 type II CAAX endopeptidase family protein [Staphylococcus simulans]